MELTKTQILNSDVFTFTQKFFVRKSTKEIFNVDSFLNIKEIDYIRNIECDVDYCIELNKM